MHTNYRLTRKSLNLLLLSRFFYCYCFTATVVIWFVDFVLSLKVSVQSHVRILIANAARIWIKIVQCHYNFSLIFDLWWYFLLWPANTVISCHDRQAHIMHKHCCIKLCVSFAFVQANSIRFSNQLNFVFLPKIHKKAKISSEHLLITLLCRA